MVCTFIPIYTDDEYKKKSIFKDEIDEDGYSLNRSHGVSVCCFQPTATARYKQRAAAATATAKREKKLAK